MPEKIKTPFRRALSGTVLLSVITALLLTGCSGGFENLDLSMYQYRDTKDLVRFVYQAAVRLESEENAVQYFIDHHREYYSADHYLYIYDTDGVNVFHAGMEYLEGRELRDITDIDGKNIFNMIVEALDDPGNPHAWVHYSWWEPGGFYPVPKSSCHFRVVTPEGRELIVGGGMNYPHEEREFARIVVDSAVEVLESEGEDGIPIIDDPESMYNYRDVKVFAFRPDSSIVISPVVEDSILHVNIIDAVDEAGNRPFLLAMRQLESQDAAWQVFLERNRYHRQLVKKVLYLRIAMLSGDTVYVGAVTELPEPP
jgi:hypothetical protein